MGQTIIRTDGHYDDVGNYLAESGIRHALLVCGRYIDKLNIGSYIKKMDQEVGVKTTVFNGFSPNPKYESVLEGVKVFKQYGCDGIVAVGGGSAIDVAKCIKLISGMGEEGDIDSLQRKDKTVSNIRLMAVPTTAGSGSEATKFAVVYRDGKKLSVADEECLPDAVVFDKGILKTLPEYQKKATMLDAMCHAIESCWSVNSTVESRGYSVEALGSIMDNMDGYLAGSEEAEDKMQEAAYLAGKAINIAQTTAGHAMSYKLTGLYGIAHGHAAALCVRELWPWLITHSKDAVSEPRLNESFALLADGMHCMGPTGASEEFSEILDRLGLEVPTPEPGDIDILVSSVNQERLKNSPIVPGSNDIRKLYMKIFDHVRSDSAL
ncbi:MAG: phosphonoacetaldehyde reductase [Lachnospiraceae bacterium]|nr:phosphonoacetaldehyde reductase [Lachnospiraceae bacterium]